jgi:hypothetical protein
MEVFLRTAATDQEEGEDEIRRQKENAIDIRALIAERQAKVRDTALM